MSLRPVTTGVTAGSSVALALKLLGWVDPTAVPPWFDTGNTSQPAKLLEPWSFLLGLLCGLLVYSAIEWFFTLRWALVTWIQHHCGALPASTAAKKELYKLL